MARELETGGLIETRTAPIAKDAVEAFLSDARARGLMQLDLGVRFHPDRVCLQLKPRFLKVIQNKRTGSG